MNEVLIELDDRRRVSLGRVGRPEHRRYIAHAEPDGTIVLVPAVVMSESQARLLAAPEVLEQIERAVADQPSRHRTGRLTRRE